MIEAPHGPSTAASRTFAELETMDTLICPHAAFARHHAQVQAGLNTDRSSLKAAHFILAAAALIRAAELIEQQESTAAAGDGPLAAAADGAGSERLNPHAQAPSPSAADPAQY